jgi:PDZ domain-containing protein
LSSTATVLPEFPEYRYEGGSIEQQWITSQEMAMIAASSHQGIEVPATVTIVEIDVPSNALGLLRENDVILAIDGETVVTYEDLDTAFDSIDPGDRVTVTVDRAGQEVSESFETIDNGEGRAIMGIWVDPEFDFPFVVNIGIDNVGGPSGGTMFALGIIDLLTPQDELKGEKVAGTGTIDIDGNVGPIGGIALKMAGAADAGSDWFLAPSSNCPGVLGNVPDDLTVVAVSTLDEAYDAMVAIGMGDTASLPTCA